MKVGEHARSMKIDRILTGRYTAIPTFLLVMLLIFYLTFNVDLVSVCPTGCKAGSMVLPFL